MYFQECISQTLPVSETCLCGWWKSDALQIVQFLAWFTSTTVTTWLVVRLTLPTKSFLIFSCTFHPSHKLRGIHTHCLPKWTRDNFFCDLMSYDCKAITLQSVWLPNDVKTVHNFIIDVFPFKWCSFRVTYWVISFPLWVSLGLLVKTLWENIRQVFLYFNWLFWLQPCQLWGCCNLLLVVSCLFASF